VDRLRDALRLLQAAHLTEKEASVAALAALASQAQTAEQQQARLEEASAECLRLETRLLEAEEETQELAQVWCGVVWCGVV
jgi:hypothetical protein